MSNNKLITTHKCGICGNVFNAQYMKFTYDAFYPVYDDSSIRLKRRINDNQTELFTADLCPRCADKIHKTINEMLWTVGGEVYSKCDFCKFHTKANLGTFCKDCVKHSKFEKKQILHAQMDYVYKKLQEKGVIDIGE